MSGGSFDYLCYKAPGEIVDRTDQLERMADMLAAEFPGSRAAEDTRLLLEHVRLLWKSLHSGPLGDLQSNVWHAIEWWQSCDTSRERAAEAVAKYDAGRAAYDPLPHQEERLIEVQINANPGKLAKMHPQLLVGTTHATAVMDVGALGTMNVHVAVREVRS